MWAKRAFCSVREGLEQQGDGQTVRSAPDPGGRWGTIFFERESQQDQQGPV